MGLGGAGWLLPKGHLGRYLRAESGCGERVSLQRSGGRVVLAEQTTKTKALGVGVRLVGEKAPRLEWSRRVRAMVKKWAGVKWYRAQSDHHPLVRSLSDLPLTCLVH